MSENTVAAPDKAPASKRFGLIEAGDGLQYQVMRIGLNKRGEELEEMIAKITSKDSAELPASETFAQVSALYKLALAPFYSDERIAFLLENDMLGPEHLPTLVHILRGRDLFEMEKKSSSD